MREKWKQLRKGAGAACICMFVLGIVMVIWPGISVLTACMLLGIFCILGGIYEMVRYFKLGTAPARDCDAPADCGGALYPDPKYTGLADSF